MADGMEHRAHYLQEYDGTPRALNGVRVKTFYVTCDCGWVSPTATSGLIAAYYYQKHVEEGLTLKAPEIPNGIYRRLYGTDLISNYGGVWRRVTESEVAVAPKIHWKICNGGYDAGKWVLVLDNKNHPVVDGFCVEFNSIGEVIG